MRERNRLLRDEVRDPAWYRALEGQMAEAGAAITANRLDVLSRLQIAQEGADTAFPSAGLSLEGETGPRDAPGLAEALADGRGRDIAAGRTLTGPHRADLGAVYLAKDVPARQCSTGEQEGAPDLAGARQCTRPQDGNRRGPPSSCWTRSRRIWTPTVAPRSSTRSARWRRRPG